MITISIDTGNKHVKSVHFTLNAALSESDDLIVGQDNALYYNGKYYTTTTNRIAYMRDKTEDERFFILTLFAVAKEMDWMIKNDQLSYKDGELLDITLLNGLPPAHMQLQMKSFKKYFRRKDYIGMKYAGHTFNIRFAKVQIYPQCYAAAVYACKNLENYRRTVVIDIGGITEDVLVFEKNVDGNAEGVITMNADAMASLEHGVIKLFTRIEQDCNKVGCALNAQDEGMIEDAILGKISGLPKECISIIRRDAAVFAEECISIVKEQSSNLAASHVFICGGGAILLKEYLEDVAARILGEYEILEDAKANVKGYLLMYEAQK